MGTTKAVNEPGAIDPATQAGGRMLSSKSEALNHSVVVGRLVADADRRTLPSGSVAASFSLTVRVEGEKTTSVPAVWYDPPKRLDDWNVGDTIVVSGSIVRRFFRSSGGLGSATEVVVRHAELARHQTKSRTLLEHRASELTAAASTFGLSSS